MRVEKRIRINNGAKFDTTQIILSSELLSQIIGSIVVFRVRIHKELRNLLNLVRLLILGVCCFMI